MFQQNYYLNFFQRYVDYSFDNSGELFAKSEKNSLRV